MSRFAELARRDCDMLLPLLLPSLVVVAVLSVPPSLLPTASTKSTSSAKEKCFPMTEATLSVVRAAYEQSSTRPIRMSRSAPGTDPMPAAAAAPSRLSANALWCGRRRWWWWLWVWLAPPPPTDMLGLSTSARVSARWVMLSSPAAAFTNCQLRVESACRTMPTRRSLGVPARRNLTSSCTYLAGAMTRDE